MEKNYSYELYIYSNVVPKENIARKSLLRVESELDTWLFKACGDIIYSQI